MVTKETLEAVIKRCQDYKHKNPGVVFGADFPEIAKMLMGSEQFFRITATCHIEHLIWCMKMQINGPTDGITRDDMMESELFKWMSRAVYIGVQLERTSTVESGIDAALKAIEEKSKQEGGTE